MSFKSAEPFDYAPFDGFDPFDELRAGKLTAGGLRVFDRIYDLKLRAWSKSHKKALSRKHRA